MASVLALVLALAQLFWAGHTYYELGRYISRLVRQLLYGAWERREERGLLSRQARKNTRSTNWSFIAS
jgi:hypothetical protein